MAKQTMSALAVSAFCESLAVMQSAGIPAEEALGLLCQDKDNTEFRRAAKIVASHVAQGATLAQAINNSGCFPHHMCELLTVGEHTGRIETVLHSLAAYYDAQHQLQSKLRSAAIYPAVFLLLMAMVLVVLVWQVLPVFTQVYTALAGSVSSSSYAYIQGAYIISIGSLSITGFMCVVLLICAALARTRGGSEALLRFLEGFGPTSDAFLQLAQARFTAALATFVASGMDVDTAVAQMTNVRHKTLSAKLRAAREKMAQGNSLAQAFYETKVYESMYGRMLISGARSGQLEQVLHRLAQMFEQEANGRLEQLISTIEPSMAAILTLCVGLSLLGVMLPLVGILASIG